MKKITKAKVLSCLVVVAILMSVIPWMVIAQDVSNREEDLRDKLCFLSSDMAVSSSDVPTYEFLTYANFGSDNSCYTPGQGVGGYENRLYVATSGRYCYVYEVSVPAGADPNMHPDNPEAPGPMAPRTLTFIENHDIRADIYGETGINSIYQSVSEFYVDDTGIYYGPSPGGIHKWDHNWNYQGRVVDVSLSSETLAYDADNDVWYAGRYTRQIYSFRSGIDTSWQYEFTYPTYEGSHHDGLEYVNGFLWISDMTSNWIGQWKKNPDGSWEEVARFYYDNPVDDDVEGMGFEPFGHLWATGWNRLYEIGGKELGVVLEGIELSIWLDKTEYNPNELIRIDVDVDDADGNSIFPAITRDNTEVKIDGNVVDIEEITIQSPSPTFLWYEYVIYVKAPSEPGVHTVKVHVETDVGVGSDSKSFSVFEPFTFVHMTDVHMGRKIPAGVIIIEKEIATFPFTITVSIPKILWPEDIFSAAVDEMKNDIKPDFVIDTGDIADFADEGHYVRYLQVLEPLNDLSIKAYTVPGNHDRRKTILGPSNPKYLKYYNEIIIPERPENCTDLIPPNNYTFERNGYLFIGLDSGQDYSIGPNLFGTPEGSGLDDAQNNSLNEPKIKDHSRKIIFMHHPVINEDNDDWGDLAVPITNNCPGRGGNDDCIAFNRCEFISYCINNNVDLVLTGHTHKAYERIIYNDAGTQKTRFIQTPSLTLDAERHGCREFFVKADRIEQTYRHHGNYNYMKAVIESPATLHVYNSQERHTGINITSGEAERNIPRSFHFSVYTFETINEANETVNETMPEKILLYDVSEDYLFKVIANLTEEQKTSPGIETFNFTAERQTTNGSRTIIFYSNISLFENTTATLPFNLTTTNYDMEIDYDGDEIIDETRSPDFVYVDYMPKAEIISPINNSTHLFGQEIAFKGNGTDPEDGFLTNESLVWFSDIDGMIGIGNEFSNVNLSVGSHNITLRVNDTLDQMNMSTVSILIRSTQPDIFIDILKSDEIPGIEPHPELIETLADQLCNLTVYIKNTGYGTLNNVQILTNVDVTKDMGNIDEGEEKFVQIQFTPTTPGLIGLNATVRSDEIEKNVTRGLLVKKFDLKVSIGKTEYNQSEPVPINISVTSEVPNMRFIDLKVVINISSNSYNQIFDIPLLSLAPFVTKNISVTWDTTGVNNGTYTIDTLLIMANQKVVTDTKIISLGNQPPTADANGPYTGLIEEPITFNGTASYDPDGTIVSYEWDLNDDGEFDDATGVTPTITFDSPYSGDIHLQVTDDNGATDVDSTTLTVKIPATIDFDPDTLNLKSKGRWVTIYIEFPEGYDVADIDASTILVNDQAHAEMKPIELGDYDSDRVPDLMVKFDRADVQELLEAGNEIDITVTGELYDGSLFEGSDIIRVINEG